MATYLGRNAKITIGTHTVSEMMNWSITMTADPIIEPVFGDVWTTTHGLATVGWTATCEGLVDITDNAGQVTIEDALITSSGINNVRFYLDASTYITPDTDSDPNAQCYVTEYSPSQAQGDVGRVTISFQGDGPIHRKSE